MRFGAGVFLSFEPGRSKRDRYFVRFLKFNALPYHKRQSVVNMQTWLRKIRFFTEGEVVYEKKSFNEKSR